MARRHGWQLPAHTFQIVAITVFSLLTIAFYAFFAPFLGKKMYEYVAMGVYSFLAFFVLILYVRCTAIDPADPGILIEASTYKSQRDGVSLEQPSKIGLTAEVRVKKPNLTLCSSISCFLCALLAKEDCHKDKDITDLDPNNDEALFCTLCNVEVGKNSKHCRCCDKCVDGFDHHCRWLNNCVGRKNYMTFLSLMAMSLGWLAVECGVGITILVRCFTDKRATEEQIVERLGGVFSIAPFATVVALCTALSLLASIPVGELFFFHMILIRKGLTTYEYVVAMRTQSEPPGPSVNDEPLSLQSSPMSSAATSVSGASLGLQHRGAWCTPPRIFVDHLDEIIPHLEPGRVPSTVDPDAIGSSDVGKRTAKRPVRISAWKLAKLDSNEAMRAATKARASSSVLRPINSHLHYDTDRCSSGNASSRSSTMDGGFHRESQIDAPSRSSREDPETCPQTPNSFNSSHRQQQQSLSTRHFNPFFRTSANPSPFSDKSNNGSGIPGRNGLDHGISVKSTTVSTTTSTLENSRSSVFWDREAGRFVSSSYQSTGGRTELLYTGQSIFFGGPLISGNADAGPSNQQQSGDQLPVFIPKDSQARSDRFSGLP